MRNDGELNTIISKRRTELGLTLQQLADKVGVSNSTVHRWETGKIRNLGRDKIAALAAALQVSPEYLMGWTDNPGIKLRKDIAAAISGLSEEELQCVLEYISFLKRQVRCPD